MSKELLALRDAQVTALRERVAFLTEALTKIAKRGYDTDLYSPETAALLMLKNLDYTHPIPKGAA